MEFKPMKSKFLKIVLPATVGVAFFALSTEARASFIQLGRTNYLQTFDTLNSSGKSITLPPGWFLMSQDNQINADNGSATQAGIYSYGNTGSSDRALGTLVGPGKAPFFGVEFQNAGPGPINRFNISYTGEEWRLGVAGQQNLLQFQYSLNATSFADSKATWINVPSLSFTTPNLTGVGAHNGNAPANQVPVTGSISFLNIPQGSFVWMRWQEVVSGNNQGDGLAVDNFSLTAVPEASSYAAAFCAIGLLGGTFWKRRSASERAV
jgi:hypothetical protein